MLRDILARKTGLADGRGRAASGKELAAIVAQEFREFHNASLVRDGNEGALGQDDVQIRASGGGVSKGGVVSEAECLGQAVLRASLGLGIPEIACSSPGS